jgi:predicted RNA binding protein with dsRBD fold (UPF0201 family)
MKLPAIGCKIEIFSAVNPSEDFQKIKTAILNILPESNISIENFSIKAETKNFHSLEKIYESIHSTKSQRVLQRQLEKHLERDSTWFYLNKQAAYVGKTVLCEEADESPLGPLKVILTSTNIDRVIDTLVVVN